MHGFISSFSIRRLYQISLATFQYFPCRYTIELKLISMFLYERNIQTLYLIMLLSFKVTFDVKLKCLLTGVVLLAFVAYRGWGNTMTGMQVKTKKGLKSYRLINDTDV